MLHSVPDTTALCGVLPVNGHSEQKPAAAVSFEVSAGGTMEDKQVSCSLPTVFMCPCRGRKEPYLEDMGLPLVPGSSLKSACVKTPVIPEVLGSALAPH